MNSYALPASATSQLEQMVSQIEANPGRLIDVRSYDTDLDMSGVVATLPPELSEDDFVGVLKLAMLTECATDSYASEIGKRGRQFDAGWLVRFNERVWVPDEYLHAEPFKLALMGLGFDEAELDREISEAQARPFTHQGGDTPVQVTTFGMVQEYLTDHWHGLIARLLKPASPIAAKLAYHIKQRETLHMIWYRDMTAVQVAANPELVHDVGSELASFRLPGNSVAPAYQSRATEWLPKMGADFTQLTRDLVRHLHVAVGSDRQLGALMIDIAAAKDERLSLLRRSQVRWLLQRHDGWANELVGQAILERLGLSFLFTRGGEDNGSRLRRLLRTWLANRLPATVS